MGELEFDTSHQPGLQEVKPESEQEPGDGVPKQDSVEGDQPEEPSLSGAPLDEACSDSMPEQTDLCEALTIPGDIYGDTMSDEGCDEELFQDLQQALDVPWCMSNMYT